MNPIFTRNRHLFCRTCEPAFLRDGQSISIRPRISFPPQGLITLHAFANSLLVMMTNHFASPYKSYFPRDDQSPAYSGGFIFPVMRHCVLIRLCHSINSKFFCGFALTANSLSSDGDFTLPLPLIYICIMSECFLLIWLCGFCALNLQFVAVGVGLWLTVEREVRLPGRAIFFKVTIFGCQVLFL